MSGDVFEIRIISSKNCFIYIPEKWIRKIQDTKKTKTMLIRMVYGNNSIAYLSCVPYPVKDSDKNVACVNASFARNLKVAHGDNVLISLWENIPSVSSVQITPVSTDDFEILVENTSAVESSLLDQVKVVYQGQILPIWITKTFCLEVQVDALEPSTNVGCLEQFTELIVSSPISSVKKAQSHTINKPSKKVPRKDTLISDVPSTHQIISNLPKPVPLPFHDTLKENPFKSWFSFEKKIESPVPKSDSLGNSGNQLPGGSTCYTSTQVIPSSFRVHPLDAEEADLFLPCHIVLNDNLLKEVTKSNSTTSTVCKIARLVPPKILVEYKSEEGSKVLVQDNAQSQKDNEITEENRWMVFAQLISSNEVHKRFKTPKFEHDCVLVSNNIRRQLCLEIGARVKLYLNQEDLQIKNMKSIEITSIVKDSEDKEYAVNEGLKNFVHHSIHGLVLSSNTPLIVPKAALLGSSEEIIVNIKLNNSEQGYALVTREQMEACKITVNTDRSVDNNVKTISQLDAAVGPGRNTFSLQFLENLLSEAIHSIKLTLNLYSERTCQQKRSHCIQDNILIIGKSGSGKSSFAKMLCRHLQKAPHFVWTKKIDCKPLKGKKTDFIIRNLKQVFDDAVYHQPSVLIFDDIESIAGVEAEKDHQLMQDPTYKRVGRIIREMSESLQSRHAIAIGATALSASQVNQELVSARGNHLFKMILEIPDLTRFDRKEILEKAFLGLDGITIAEGLNFEMLASKTEGYTCQDLMDFIDKSVFVSWKRGWDKANLIDEHVLTEALTMSTPMALRGVELQQEVRQGWNDVGGLTSVKEELIEILQWPSMYPELFEQCPLRLQSGVLLYGAPGTGKTLLAGAVARECGVNFISIKGPELLSKYIGASEESVRKVFEKAMSAKPCVLFFDEFDSLAPRRGHDSTGVTDRVVNQLLTQLDGVEGLNGVWVLAATSRPDLVDPAILRPGRLDRIIHCPLPDEDDRLSILRALSRHMRLNSDVNFVKLAKNTQGFTGADLQAVLYTSQLSALEEREKKLQTSKHCTENDGSGEVLKTVSNKEPVVLEIAERHIQQSLSSTRLSLPPTEYERYRRIYDRFAATRGIATADMLKNQLKATLA